MRIFLIGFPGSGKTTIGKRLAEPIGFDFVDTDTCIEQREGTTVARIFAERGRAAFRKIEHDVLQELMQRDFVVISTGGGMPCFHGNMDAMLAGGKTVYLKTNTETLVERLMHSKTERPLIQGKTKDELQRYIEEELAEREAFYERAHITVQTERFSMDQLLRSLQLMKHE